MGNIIKKLKTSSGYTMAELLLAILILLMVATIVTTGIPSAQTAYEKVVLASNADILLSTTISSLRNELGAAKISTPVENNYVSYYSGAFNYNAANGRYVSSGTRSVICRNESLYSAYKSGTDPDKCIMIQRYAPLRNVDYSPEMKEQMRATRLVSKAASNKNLYVTYDSVTYNETTGILTFTDLKVCRDSDTDAAHSVTKPVTLSIRVLSY